MRGQAPSIGTNEHNHTVLPRWAEDVKVGLIKARDQGEPKDEDLLDPNSDAEVDMLATALLALGKAGPVAVSELYKD